jgi:aspartate 1-decarboxylase
MQITLMKGKILRQIMHHEGSISLMDTAGFLINERVEIHKIETEARFDSYLIEAPWGLAP